MLNWLDSSQVIYCDTDSVMFLCDENNPSHKSPYRELDIEDTNKVNEFGNGLGMWEDEYSDGEYVEELVVAGPKPYTYRATKDNVVCRQDGITIDRANATLVCFCSSRELVLNAKNNDNPSVSAYMEHVQQRCGDKACGENNTDHRALEQKRDERPHNITFLCGRRMTRCLAILRINSHEIAFGDDIPTTPSFL